MELLGKSKELVKAGATRFGTHTLVGERLMELKNALQQTVFDSNYVAEKYKDLPDNMELSNCETRTRQNKGGTAKKLVTDDSTGCFWDRIAGHVAVTLPIYKLLRRHDSSAPTVGKVYSGFFEMGESIKASNVSYSADALEKHGERWSYGHVPFFGAAYVLDPEFIDHNQASNAEVMEGLMETTRRIGILVEVRRLEKLDKRYSTLWEKRATLIAGDKMAQKTYDHYPTYPSATDTNVKAFGTAVISQLALYRNRKGMFAYECVMDAAKNMPAYLWWDQNGATVPQLQTMARLVLAQPASASIIERINSEFEFIKDRRRNRLKHERANKLVSLFHNLRLMKRMREPRYVEATVGWVDVEDMLDKSGVAKYGVMTY